MLANFFQSFKDKFSYYENMPSINVPVFLSSHVQIITAHIYILEQFHEVSTTCCSWKYLFWHFYIEGASKCKAIRAIDCIPCRGTKTIEEQLRICESASNESKIVSFFNGYQHWIESNWYLIVGRCTIDCFTKDVDGLLEYFGLSLNELKLDDYARNHY